MTISLKRMVKRYNAEFNKHRPLLALSGERRETGEE